MRIPLWLGNFQTGESPATAMRAVIASLSLVAIACALLGGIVTRTCGLVFLLLVVAGWARLSQASRRSLNDELETHKRLVSRYSKVLDELHPMYQVISWEQVAYILNSRGDTHECVILRARVLRPDLQLIRLIFGCGWHQPSKYRRKVRLTVRNLLPGNVLGTSPPVTHSWLCDGKFDLIVQMPTPPRIGSEISFMVTIDWPRKCAPLMVHAVADDFAFKFVQQDVKYVIYRIVLPPGYDAYHEPIGSDNDENHYRTSQRLTEDGRRQYLFEAFNLPIMHRAGVKLQLAEPTARVSFGRGLATFRTPASPPA